MNYKLKMNQTTRGFLLATVTIILICSIVSPVTSLPAQSTNKGRSERTLLKISSDDEIEATPKQLEQVEKCYNDDDLMELCQRCAKVTKSVIVFPMCCGDEDNATMWCKEYVYFGDD